MIQSSGICAQYGNVTSISINMGTFPKLSFIWDGYGGVVLAFFKILGGFFFVFHCDGEIKGFFLYFGRFNFVNSSSPRNPNRLPHKYSSSANQSHLLQINPSTQPSSPRNFIFCLRISKALVGAVFHFKKFGKNGTIGFRL